jgi:hypothetical protein
MRLRLLAVAAAALPLVVRAATPAPRAPAAAKAVAPSKPAAPAPKGVAATAAPAAPLPPLPAGWKAVTAKEAGFTAYFPGEPQRELEPRPGALFAAYLLDRAGSLSSAGVFMVSAGDEGPAVADSVFALLTQEDGAKVTREYEATVDGRSARASDIESADSVIAVRRVVAFGRHYLLLLRVPRGEVIPEADQGAFFGSFRLLPGLDATPPAAEEPAAARPSTPEEPAPFRALPAARPASGFKEVVATDSGFAIAFPGEPTREASEDGSFTGYQLKAPKDGCSFMAITVTATGDDVRGALERNVAELLEQFGPSIQRDEPATLAGLPGRALTAMQGDSRIEMRFVIAKNRLHGLMVGADGATPSEADQKAFFGSFRVLP